MRIAKTIVATSVFVASVAVAAELIRFNDRLGGLPYMTVLQTWQTPNYLSSVMFLLGAVAVGAVTTFFLPTTRFVLTGTLLYSGVALVALWALHRTLVVIQSSASSGAISWW
jgi:hypothetical protein